MATPLAADSRPDGSEAIRAPAALGRPPRLVRIGRARVPGESESSYNNSDFWGLHLYYGKARVAIGQAHFDLAAGSITVTPRSARSVYCTDAPLGHIFVHFRLDGGEDCLGESILGEDVGNEGVVGRSCIDDRRVLPLFLPPSPDSEPIAKLIVETLAAWRSDRLLAEAKLWEALLSAARLSADSRSVPPTHPALEAALSYIELHLPEPCSLAVLSDHAGVSATHLNRLFRDATDRSAVAYVRDKRMELAHYLLVATALPVKDIAYQVGIPDPHAFNKLCKRYFGSPPTGLREAS